MTKPDDWKPWLRRVGAAALSGMSDEELRADPEAGFHIALNAIRGAYRARAASREDQSSMEERAP